MEEFNFEDIKKKIFKETNDAINYYDNCSYIKRKIEENMKLYKIMEFNPKHKGRRKKIIKPKIVNNKSYKSIINFEEGRKKVLKQEDKSKQIMKVQDDDILML